jgi:enamine deaminase RidA (YjgF/YER057c/UK114 family)
MSQALAHGAQAPLHTLCACGKPTCSGEVVTVETAYATEIFVRCAPTLEDPELTFADQARRFYGCLPRLLNQAGAEVHHVVLERVYFRDFARDMDLFGQIRREAYRAAGVTGADLPATTYIQQPPCRAAQKLELQTYAVLPKSPQAVTVRSRYDAASDTTAKLLEMGAHQHLYISNIRGLPADPAAEPGSFRQQSDRMFAYCQRLLADYGTTFPEVLRTWCYMVDIDNTYADFNLSRNDFFAREGVRRLPASTGIEAHLWPLTALCGMDLYAIVNPQGVTVEIMHTPTLNEAADYGSSFSRGMKVDLPEKTVLFISGTASVDEAGATVHLDDIRKQLERMLLNIQELLAPHGASFADLTQATTYLKQASYLDLCEQVFSEWGMRHLPNTFVEAGVCRPDLLCEMEAIAILPKRPGNGQPLAAQPAIRTG